ncbi:MAG: hypothetical protein CME32_31740 [Gimesia sp.]|nr:hypothetical protein [Gimesia sp.]
MFLTKVQKEQLCLQCNQRRDHLCRRYSKNWKRLVNERQSCPGWSNVKVLPPKYTPIQNLAIVSCHFNPCGFKMPVENCKRYLDEIGYPVTLVELSFTGEFQFEESIKIKGDITKSNMWQKERLINIGISAQPPEVDAVAWIDADAIFQNPYWYEETRQLLSEHPIVQLYSHIEYLDPYGHVDRKLNSWSFNYHNNITDRYGTPGLAWAARREVIPDGIYDQDIVGGGDSHLIASWIDRTEWVEKKYLALRRPAAGFAEWKQRQLPRVNGDIACLSGTIKHLFHGCKSNRQYTERLDILHRHNFDIDDIRVNEEGIWEWASNKPGLHRDVANYFFDRKEDEILPNRQPQRVAKMEQYNTSYYDRKYSRGDFNYDPVRHQKWLKNNLIERFNLRTGDILLDLGCGKGLHASLLASEGLQVFGIEPSREGIKGAIDRSSDAIFICAGASELSKYFDKQYFDMIFCRGMSWFHRELDQVCPSTGVNVSEKIEGFFRFIKPGGLFVLQIWTDFSGSRPANDIHNNRLADYIKIFAPHGEIIHVSNWDGVALVSDEQAEQEKGGIVIATRKPMA